MALDDFEEILDAGAISPLFWVSQLHRIRVKYVPFRHYEFHHDYSDILDVFAYTVSGSASVPSKCFANVGCYTLAVVGDSPDRLTFFFPFHQC